MKETVQVRIRREGIMGFRAMCEATDFKGQCHQRKAWALEEAQNLFMNDKLVLQGKDPNSRDEIYLVVERTREEQEKWIAKEHARRIKEAKKNCGPATDGQVKQIIKTGLSQAREISAKRQAQAVDGKFELVPAQDAETEKKIASHVKVIKAAIKGNKRARNLFFAYAAIAGAHANALMELAPHGQGEKLLEQHFGEDYRTVYNWRKFASDLQPRLAKNETVSLLTAPQLSKKALPAKAAQAIQEAVLEVMDGQGMVEFMRSCKALREPDTNMDRGDKTKPRKPNAAEQAEAAKLTFQGYQMAIQAMIEDEQSRKLCDPDQFQLTKAVTAKWLEILRDHEKQNK